MPRARTLQPASPVKVERAIARYWSHVRKSIACWLWEGSVRGEAGRFSWKGKDWSARRLGWTLAGRQIRTGAALWNTCGKSLCVRPDHMRVARERAMPGGVESAALRKTFWSNVVKRGRGCWPWRGVTNVSGYGMLRVKGRRYVPARRLAWALTRGPLPPGKVIVLRCRTTGCVRPEHLRLGEPADVHQPIEERLWSRVKKTRGCWKWQGPCLPAGHGVIAWKGRSRLVQRVVWMLERGSIPRGKQVFHLCASPACVRPDHLRVGTRSQLWRHILRQGRHWSQVHPESHVRGDAHPFRQHPELAKRGEDHHRAILNDEAVRDIRARYGRDGSTHRTLAEEYGVHRSTIGYALRGITWKHIQ